MNVFQALRVLHLWNQLQKQLKEVNVTLTGYRTYIAMAIAVVCEGIKQVVPDWSAIATTIQNIAVLLGLGFVRAAVTNETKGVK